MSTELLPSDLAAAVAKVQAGEWTQVHLGTWAHRAHLNDLNEAVPFSRHHSEEIADVIFRLMALAEGADFALDEKGLESLVAELNSMGE